MTPDLPNPIQKDIERLLRQHSLALRDCGYGMSRAQLKKKDLIDFSAMQAHTHLNQNLMLSAVLPELVVTDEYNQYQNQIPDQERFYHRIPVLSEGVYRLLDDPLNKKPRWIYFQIKEINTADSHPWFKIFLQLYFLHPNDVFAPSVSGTLLFRHEDNQNLIVRTENNCKNYSDVSSMVPYSTLGWNQESVQLWENTVRKHNQTIEHKMGENTHPMLNLAALFRVYTEITDYLIHTEKMHTKRKTAANPAEKTKIAGIPAENTAVPNTKRTRTLGLVTIKSEDRPKPSNMTTIRRYKTASWTARGGIRHLKSGKAVPFKPCVKHRKALKDTNAATPQTTIKIKPGT